MIFNIATAAAALAIIPSAIFAAPIRSREVTKSQILPKASGSASAVPRRRCTPSSRSNKVKRQSSTVEAVLTGYVTVTDAQSNFLGYLVGEPDSTGIFAYNLTEDTDAALYVGFEAIVGNNATSRDIVLTLQSDYSEYDSQYPFVAAVNGFYNDGTGEIGDSSANYAYFSISEEGFSSSTAQNGTNLFDDIFEVNSTQENAIWVFNENTDDFAAAWVNADQNSTSVHFVQTQGYLLMTGNTTAFIDIYGGSEVFLGLEEYFDQPIGTYDSSPAPASGE